MNLIYYNEATTLGYKHVPNYASANVVTGTKYVTEVYLVQNGARYPLGQYDGKLDEEEIKLRFADTMNQHQERQYGQQDSLFRKDIPIKPRGNQRSIAESQARSKIQREVSQGTTSSGPQK